MSSDDVLSDEEQRHMASHETRRHIMPGEEWCHARVLWLLCALCDVAAFVCFGNQVDGVLIRKGYIWYTSNKPCRILVQGAMNYVIHSTWKKFQCWFWIKPCKRDSLKLCISSCSLSTIQSVSLFQCNHANNTICVIVSMQPYQQYNLCHRFNATMPTIQSVSSFQCNHANTAICVIVSMQPCQQYNLCHRFNATMPTIQSVSSFQCNHANNTICVIVSMQPCQQYNLCHRFNATIPTIQFVS